MDIDSELSEHIKTSKWKKMRQCDNNKCKKLFKINEDCVKFENCDCVFHEKCFKNW